MKYLIILLVESYVNIKLLAFIESQNIKPKRLINNALERFFIYQIRVYLRIIFCVYLKSIIFLISHKKGVLKAPALVKGCH